MRCSILAKRWTTSLYFYTVIFAVISYPCTHFLSDLPFSWEGEGDWVVLELVIIPSFSVPMADLFYHLTEELV